ncbi:MAG: choice-of-anchor J domain-containing protein [Bacteroidales bacterium]
MKRINFILGFLFFLGLTSQGQKIFHEDFSAIDYNSQGVGDLPASWVLYNDANQTAGQFTYIDKAWKALKTTHNETVAVSTSWFKAPKMADRWLITPQINLSTATHPFLIFRAAAADMSYTESYWVCISKGDSAKTSFTDTLLKATTQNGDWKEISIDLAAYKNQKIRIAFILRSIDQYALYLDNIELSNLSKPWVDIQNFILPNLSGVNQAIEIKGLAKSKTKDTIHNYVVNYRVNDTLLVSTPIRGLCIPLLAEFNFAAQKFIPSQIGTYTLKMWISQINDQEGVASDTLTQTMVISEDELYHRVALFEIFSSGTCSPCASANPSIHAALQSIGYNQKESKVIALKYQVQVPNPGDPAFVPENALRFSYYNASGAPALFLSGNRLQKTDSWNELETLLPSAVEKVWLDRTPFALHIDGTRKSNRFLLNVEIHNKTPYTGETALFIAFIEDSLSHKPASNGETIFYTVVRKMLPSALGESIYFPKPEMQLKRTYDYTFDGINPILFNSIEGVSALVFLQDVNTKEILQAAILPATAMVGNEEENSNIQQVQIYPNPVHGPIHIAFFTKEKMQVKIGLYDLSGRALAFVPSKMYAPGRQLVRFDMQKYTKGIYLIKIENAGTTIVKKIVLP